MLPPLPACLPACLPEQGCQQRFESGADSWFILQLLSPPPPPPPQVGIPVTQLASAVQVLPALLQPGLWSACVVPEATQGPAMAHSGTLTP